MGQAQAAVNFNTARGVVRTQTFNILYLWVSHGGKMTYDEPIWFRYAQIEPWATLPALAFPLNIEKVLSI